MMKYSTIYKLVSGQRHFLDLESQTPPVTFRTVVGRIRNCPTMNIHLRWFVMFPYKNIGILFKSNSWPKGQLTLNFTNTIRTSKYSIPKYLWISKYMLKGHWTTLTSSPHHISSPHIFPKKLKFLYHQKRMHLKWLHANFYLQLQLSNENMKNFLSAAIFKSRLQ